MYCLTACEGRVARSFTGWRVTASAGATGGGELGSSGGVAQCWRSGGRLIGEASWSVILHSASFGPTAPIR